MEICLQRVYRGEESYYMTVRSITGQKLGCNATATEGSTDPKEDNKAGIIFQSCFKRMLRGQAFVLFSPMNQSLEADCWKEA